MTSNIDKDSAMSKARAQKEIPGVEGYLEGEQTSDVRHEYLAGQIYSMVGASDRHGLICLNLGSHLRPLLRGTPCQLFIADMKLHLRLGQEDCFYYPDLILSCDPEDRQTYYRERPCLIVEVLCAATERVDRREKFLAYTRLDSLREYLLISQDLQQVDVFRRDTDWRRDTITEGKLRLHCLDAEVPLSTIYEDVEL